jgi:hypothetical protein
MRRVHLPIGRQADRLNMFRYGRVSGTQTLRLAKVMDGLVQIPLHLPRYAEV